MKKLGLVKVNCRMYNQIMGKIILSTGKAVDWNTPLTDEEFEEFMKFENFCDNGPSIDDVDFGGNIMDTARALLPHWTTLMPAKEADKITMAIYGQNDSKSRLNVGDYNFDDKMHAFHRAKHAGQKERA